MKPLLISPLSLQSLNTFFDNFDFSEDSEHIKKYISFIKEATFCYQNIIHKFYSALEDEIVGFVVLSTKSVDEITGIFIEFLYLKPKYRNKMNEITDTKYSYFLLDYVIKIAIKIQKEVAINHIYLVPINDKVRIVYQEYGFENIPNSGNNGFEDYMVFNLLEEDATIF